MATWDSWSVRIGRGWKDNMPPDVKATFERHDYPEVRGVIGVEADSLLVGLQGCSSMPIYVQEDGIRSLSKAFRAIERFLFHLCQDKGDVVSLVFINREPETFTLRPRPESVVRDATSLLDALTWFSESVIDSIEGKEMWSVCEWAMVSCTRRTE